MSFAFSHERRPARGDVVDHVGLVRRHGEAVHAQRAVPLLDARVLELHLHRAAVDLGDEVEDRLEVLERVGLLVERRRHVLRSCRASRTSSERPMFFISVAIAVIHALACSWMS